MYYYLNSASEVCGPHTAAELQALLAAGTITPRTPVAREGTERWVNMEMMDFTEPVVEPVGYCPHCGTWISAATTPAVCPYCGKGLHPGTQELWGSFVYAFKQYVTFRGRATRTEFWGFYLFQFLISAGADLVLQGLASLVFLLPLLAVTFRRLHDTGRSGIPVIMSFVSFALTLVMAVIFLVLGSSSGVGDSIVPLYVAGGALLLVTIVSALYVFVHMLLPSAPGPNKYGPSALYPHGNPLS